MIHGFGGYFALRTVPYSIYIKTSTHYSSFLRGLLSCSTYKKNPTYTLIGWAGRALSQSSTLVESHISKLVHCLMLPCRSVNGYLTTSWASAKIPVMESKFPLQTSEAMITLNHHYIAQSPDGAACRKNREVETFFLG